MPLINPNWLDRVSYLDMVAVSLAGFGRLYHAATDETTQVKAKT
jgi:hypothetical protein